jgi:hypothetical protein
MAQVEGLMNVSKEIRSMIAPVDNASCSSASGVLSATDSVVRRRKLLLSSIAKLAPPNAEMRSLAASFERLETAKLKTDLAYQSWARRLETLSQNGQCSPAAANLESDSQIVADNELVAKQISLYLSLWNALAPGQRLATWPTGSSSTI